MIFLRLPGVDTIDLVFDFPPHQVHQLRDRLAVEVARVREPDSDLPADAPRMRVQHDDPVCQPNRFADAVRDEKVKVLKSIRRLNAQYIRENTVRAQYLGDGDGPGYLEEGLRPRRRRRLLNGTQLGRVVVRINGAHIAFTCEDRAICAPGR